MTLFQNGSKPPKNNILGNVKVQGLSALLTKIGLYSSYNISVLCQDLYIYFFNFCSFFILKILADSKLAIEIVNGCNQSNLKNIYGVVGFTSESGEEGAIKK